MVYSGIFSIMVLLGQGWALSIPSDAKEQSGILVQPLQFRQAPSLRKRHEKLDLGVQSGDYPFADIFIGSDKQKVTVVFDTGSFVTWVNPKCEKSTDPERCKSFGRFNAGTSTSFQSMGPEWTDGSGFVLGGQAVWTWAKDDIVVGSAKLPMQPFGPADDSQDMVSGIIGAAIQNAEQRTKHPSLIDSLADHGLTKSRAFSIHLGSTGSSTKDQGSVIFGGIDTKKFTGRLRKLPNINEGELRGHGYTVPVQGLSFSKDNLNTPIIGEGETLAMDIDSGAPLSVFPSNIAQKIVQAFPDAEKKEGDAIFSVPCSAKDIKGSLDFKFGDALIKHAFSDFVVEEGEDCILGFMEEDTNVKGKSFTPILGVPFLRSAYVVFDQDNFEVHIANSADCGSNLVAIGQGPAAVPQVPGECEALA